MRMTMYVIYESPLDFPRKFVVRRWLLDGAIATAERAALRVCDRLEEARTAIPAGAANIGRYQADDPAIREVWI
jgi:hypothetical protein